jgi:hypothetical protein
MNYRNQFISFFVIVLLVSFEQRVDLSAVLAVYGGLWPVQVECGSNPAVNLHNPSSRSMMADNDRLPIKVGRTM